MIWDIALLLPFILVIYFMSCFRGKKVLIAEFIAVTVTTLTH